MLDTNSLIYFIKNDLGAVARRIGALEEADTLCMSFVTYGELLKGAERSSKRVDVHRRLDGLIRQVEVVYPKSRAICEHYAVQSTRLKIAGTPIGLNDLWIACQALAEGATLVTHNLREFTRVTGLATEDWAK